jgi:ssDNA-binding Zn-finger/Zn-ribbon topoisomerase 1
MKMITNGTEVTITCPECENQVIPKMVKLIVRTNSITEEQFLGCPNYPGCRHTQPLPQSVQMKLLGHPTLF